jgi:hypothetical protein
MARDGSFAELGLGFGGRDGRRLQPQRSVPNLRSPGRGRRDGFEGHGRQDATEMNFRLAPS